MTTPEPVTPERDVPPPIWALYIRVMEEREAEQRKAYNEFFGIEDDVA